MKEHELDQFMIALENAGILTGWSKFMGYDEPKDDSSETEKRTLYHLNSQFSTLNSPKERS